MTVRRLLSLVLMLGMLMLGAPTVAMSAPAHHPAPADCAPDTTDKSSPACVQICVTRTVCPPTPTPAAAAVGSTGKSAVPHPVDDRIAGRSLGPEPPPPRS